ncbi:hypothetical protein [Sphingobium sp. LB126]|nr:hypothetical protein [Sphingobium sp. LB126]
MVIGPVPEQSWTVMVSLDITGIKPAGTTSRNANTTRINARLMVGWT